MSVARRLAGAPRPRRDFGGSAWGALRREASTVVTPIVDVPVLKVEGLCVEFRTRGETIRAVDDVSFSISRGKTVALVGESGSGKSVTSQALMGLLSKPPAVVSGKIQFSSSDGQELRLDDMSDDQMRVLRGDRIAMIFQEPMTSLNPVHTIGKQLSEPLLIHRGASARQCRQAATEMLERVGIPEAARRVDQYPHELSGGMRQRVMIGMALMCGPSLLIADEPTTALDVTIQAQILNELHELQRDLNMSMLFITHDLGVVAEVAHFVAVMYAGQMIESGPTREILANPRHPYTRGLLASVPRASVNRQHPLTAIPGSVPDPRSLPKGCRFHPRCANAVPGRCDVEAPQLETLDDGRSVRCLRTREL